MKKKKPYEIRLNDDGSLDEIVAKNANVHLEQMSNNSWILLIDTGKKHIQVSLYTKGRAAIHAFAEEDS